MIKNYLITVEIDGPEEHLAELTNGLRAIYEDNEQYNEHCWSILTTDSAERIEHRLSNFLYRGSMVIAEISGEIFVQQK